MTSTTSSYIPEGTNEMASTDATQIKYRYACAEQVREPVLYCLSVEKNDGGGWTPVFVSDPFTEDEAEAERFAEIFTRNDLSPVHLYEVIDDLQGV